MTRHSMLFVALLGLAGVGPLGAQSNAVTITPPGYVVAPGDTITVTIAWCGYPPPSSNTLDMDSRVIEVNGVDMTGDFDLTWDPEACGFEGDISDEILYSSTGQVIVTSATGTVTVWADIQNYLGAHWSASETFYPPAPLYGVAVTAANQFVTADASSARVESFTIQNLGSVTDSFTVAASGCSSGAIATSCSLSGTSVTLGAGSQTTVTASYTASATPATTGLLFLKATSKSTTAFKDSTWTDVVVQALPSVGVAILGLAPGRDDVLSREACVTVALTDAAASECGDLRLVHALPAVRTMGTVRAPTLLYNSQHARPKPIVLADVRVSAGVALPDSVIACIKIGGVSKGCERWAGSAWGAQGNTRRIAVRGDDGLAAGEHSVTLEVTAKNGNQGPYTDTARLFIVDRSGSQFGAGWWLAGLERVTVISGTVLLWTGGDGSVRRYVKEGSVYRAPKFAELDSIVVDGSDYIRRTAEHAQVRFSSTGRHLKTTNSLGHATVFSYSDTLLTGIQVPTVSGTVSYTLSYTSGRLTSVVAPGSRTTTIYRTSARIDSIADPDGNKVRYGSGSSLNQYVVTSRKDRRGNSTTFSYDAANRLSGAARPLSNTTAMSVFESRGVTPILRESAFTMVIGPRSDTTQLWSNGHGAPLRVRNALGQETRLRYDATWPGLPDSVVTPARIGSRAYFNSSRGVLDSAIVRNPLGTSVDAKTQYKWHGSMNRITSVRTPTAASTWLVDSLSYDGDGNLAWQQRGHSDKRINYTYNGNKLAEKLVLPGADTVIFTHDPSGNVRKERSPSGFLTLTFNNSVGLDSVVYTARGTGTDATDSANVVAKGVRTWTRLNIMGQDTATVTTGPTLWMPNSRKVLADTVRTRSAYDAEGNRTSLVRRFTSTKDTVANGMYETNASEWQYDALNRVTQQKDAGSGWTYLNLDAAGNDTATVTPRGYTIRSAYDALNRLTRRIVPEVSYSSSNCNYTIGMSCLYTFPIIEGPTLCIGVDSLRYRYDAAGNMVAAENKWAKVRRGYAPNGLLTHDTLRTRTYETAAPGSCGGGDKSASAEGPGDGDFGVHVYPLRFEYDLAGRRTKLYHVDALDPCSGPCQQTYNYDATFGTLSSLVHLRTNGGTTTTSYSYDDQLRLLTITHPSTGTARSTTRSYDKDGRIASRVGPATVDTLTYDATGRVVGGTVELPSGSPVTLTMGYNGLGALQYAEGNIVGVTYEEFKTDALGNRLWVRDPEMLDGINRTRYHVIDYTSGQLSTMALGTAACAVPSSAGASCHPAWYEYEFEQDHDASGNVSATWGLDTRGTDPDEVVWPDESRSYYSADERLTYYNRHLGYSTPGDGTGMFAEYRYDALGRRVYSRVRRPSTCNSPCEAYVHRTVWDGDQVLAEIRSSGQTGTDPYYMNQEGGVAPGDNALVFGRVIYSHAIGIDQPAAALKYDGSSWYYLTPHANWQGSWSYGTIANGNICTTASSNCPLWPGFQRSADGLARGAEPPTDPVWWGDIFQSQADGSGLQYLRNRYYDPATGRFTQQDPIGLAGGLNLYGFASGDPVNFSDPLGLCTPWPECRFQQLANWGARRGGGVGAAALNIGAGLNAASEAAGLNDIGRAIGQGDVLGTGFALATTLPVGKIGKLSRFVDHIPASGKRATRAEHAAVDDIGERLGCHQCGARSPGTASGSWVPDHQPPTALTTAGEPQVLKPHCLMCSRQQGGQVSQEVRRRGQL